MAIDLGHRVIYLEDEDIKFHWSRRRIGLIGGGVVTANKNASGCGTSAMG